MPSSANLQPLIAWRFIRPTDRPIPEDTWIASVLQSEEQRHRWREWHERPRYALAVDVGPWSAIAVAFRESTADNALLELFRSMDAHQRAVAWAVSKATGEIYRLSMHLAPKPSASADVAVAIQREPDVPDPLRTALQTIPPEAWGDPVLRARWEEHLIDPAHWVLSQCHRRLTRVAQPGEFASFTLSDQLSYVGSLFAGVLEVETLPPQRHRSLYERLYRRERMLHMAVIKVLLAQLDRDLRGSIRQVQHAAVQGGLSAVCLNWLAVVSGSASMSREPRQRRLQALIAAPLLIPWLLGDRSSMQLRNVDGHEAVDEVQDDGEHNSGGQDAFPARAITISDVVDSGKRLYPLLAQLTGLSLRTVRHLRLSNVRIYQLVERVDHLNDDQVVSRLRWLDAIPVEQWPQTQTTWRRWANTLKELWSQCDHLFALITPPPHPWIDEAAPQEDADEPRSPGRGAIALGFYKSLAGRRWQLRLGQAYDLPGDDASADALRFAGMELKDFVRSLREAARDELDDYGEPALLPLPPSVSDLLHHWQIEDWWAASERWHAALTEAGIPAEEHGGRSRTECDTLPWLPLLDHPFRTEGEAGEYSGLGELNCPPRRSGATENSGTHVVRFLSSAGMLNEEGEGLKHCVGTYAWRCVTGRWHIASLSDGNGVRCSTASFQLRFEAGRWSAPLEEHRGANNAKPSAHCARVVRTLQALLAKQVMQLRYVQLEAARVERAAVCREHRYTVGTRGRAVSLAALRAALPVNVFEALVGGPR